MITSDSSQATGFSPGANVEALLDDIVQSCVKYVLQGGEVVSGCWDDTNGNCGCPLAIWAARGKYPLPQVEIPGGYSSASALRLYDTGAFNTKEGAEVFRDQFTDTVDDLFVVEEARNQTFIDCANKVMRKLRKHRIEVDSA